MSLSNIALIQQSLADCVKIHKEIAETLKMNADQTRCTGRTTQMLERVIQLAKDQILFRREEKIYVVGASFSHVNDLKVRMIQLCNSLYLHHVKFIALSELRKVIGAKKQIMLIDHYAVQVANHEHFEMINRLIGSGAIILDQTLLEHKVF